MMITVKASPDDSKGTNSISDEIRTRCYENAERKLDDTQKRDTREIPINDFIPDNKFLKVVGWFLGYNVNHFLIKGHELHNEHQFAKSSIAIASVTVEEMSKPSKDVDRGCKLGCLAN